MLMRIGSFSDGLIYKFTNSLLRSTVITTLVGFLHKLNLQFISECNLERIILTSPYLPIIEKLKTAPFMDHNVYNVTNNAEPAYIKVVLVSELTVSNNNICND